MNISIRSCDPIEKISQSAALHCQLDVPLQVFQHLGRKFMRNARKTGPIYAQQFVSLFQATIFSGGAVHEHLVDVDREVSVGGAFAPHNAETKSLFASVQ